MNAAAEIRAVAAAELDRAVDPAVAALAEPLTRRPGVEAVLFYGAWHRAAPGPGGPVDLYVLTSGDAAYHGRRAGALANRLLPPNVYRERPNGPEAEALEAKVAVMRLAAFRARMRRQSFDTTLWARFSQPATLVWARDAAARAAVIDAVASAIQTAGWWASRLAPPGADAEDTWRALYAATYAAELRVEQGGTRAADLVAASAARYRGLYEVAVAPHGAPSAQDRIRAARAWDLRRRIGKLLNGARLVKAALTYEGGVAYALSKVERHSGRAVALSPWQRRWPWLAAPVVAWRLLRERRLR